MADRGGYYFEDIKENKKFLEYLHTRNQQMYEDLINGMDYGKAEKIYGLSKFTIKSMWKKYRRENTI